MEEQAILSENFTESDFDLRASTKGWTKIIIADHGLKRRFFIEMHDRNKQGNGEEAE